ncbi:MAG: indole-3-glycerol phosphate synthase [Nitrososphaeraceae archaeon]|nr:indole-3-glycerol phosphate synthase [Nitrososphaeraceae archaeon]
MSKFFTDLGILKTLTNNSYKAINIGMYDGTKYNYTHDCISMIKNILECRHAPLITELKLSSPSKGKIIDENEIDLVYASREMVNSGVVGISILTQPYLFGGSIHNLATVRKHVSIPILMKDIIVSNVQINAAKQIGADYILLIKSVFDRNLAESDMENFIKFAHTKGLNIIYEVHTENEFKDVLEMDERNKDDLIGINNRNLSDLKVDLTITERLLKNIDKGKNIIISESGIHTPADLQYLKKCGADVFLIGTSIMESKDISKKIQEFYNAF